MKILIGYDGSEYAKAALQDLKGAGLPPVAEVLVMSVTEAWLPPSSYEIAATTGMDAGMVAQPVYNQEVRLLQMVEALAEEGAEELRKLFPGWQVKAVGTVGSPAWSLIMRADQWQPNLLVVGSRGHNAVERLFLGSVSQKVLAEARCSVRVARAPEKESELPPRLLMGHDGSEAAARTVKAIAQRNWPAGTMVRVVCVQDSLETLAGRLLGPVSGWLQDASAVNHEWAEKIVQQAVQELQAVGLEAQAKVLIGEPRRILVKDAKEWGASGIFLGATGSHGKLERFLLGSTAAAAAARANCTVEVVR